jgi:hypothetical protein
MFSFEYRLVGSGWAEARVADEHGHAVVTASYLSDALRGLIEAVALITEGAPRARCSFDEEPGEYRWIFDRHDDDVELRILAFDDLWNGQPDEAGRLVFESSQPALRIARAVLSGAQQLLDETGKDDFLRQWVEHPFPSRAMVRLRTAIRVKGDEPGSTTR